MLNLLRSQRVSVLKQAYLRLSPIPLYVVLFLIYHQHKYLGDTVKTIPACVCVEERTEINRLTIFSFIHKTWTSRKEMRERERERGEMREREREERGERERERVSVSYSGFPFPTHCRKNFSPSLGRSLSGWIDTLGETERYTNRHFVIFMVMFYTGGMTKI